MGKWIGGTQRSEGGDDRRNDELAMLYPSSTARQQTSTQSTRRRLSGPLCMARLAPRPARP
eukprot:2066224-Alexandrium_andersonii.AAC.1